MVEFVCEFLYKSTECIIKVKNIKNILLLLWKFCYYNLATSVFMEILLL